MVVSIKLVLFVCLSVWGKNTDKEGTTLEGRQPSGVFIETEIFRERYNGVCVFLAFAAYLYDITLSHWSSGIHTFPENAEIKFSDGEIYSGAELTF